LAPMKTKTYFAFRVESGTAPRTALSSTSLASITSR
jgi:hypothetical protein